MVCELKRPLRGTSFTMGLGRSRHPARDLALALGLAVAAGCSSQPAQSGPPPITDADFAACEGTPAVPFASGVAVVSASGAYRASLEAASTMQAGSPTPVATAAVGLTSFTVAVTLA